MRATWSRVALVSRLVSSALIGTFVVTQFGGTSSAATDPTVVRFFGMGSLSSLATQWQTDLVARDFSVRLQLLGQKAQEGRVALLYRDTDLAVSPFPFSDAEKETIAEQVAAGEKPNFVTVPIAASALTFAELNPLKDIFQPSGPKVGVQDVPPGPTGYSSEQLLSWAYVNPPTVVDPIYAKAHGYSVFDPFDPTNPLDENGDPIVRPGQYVTQGLANNQPILRVGPSEENYMMERVMYDRFPAMWTKYSPGTGRSVPGELGRPVAPEKGLTDFEQAATKALSEWKQGGQGGAYGLFQAYPPDVIQDFALRPLQTLNVPDTPENRAQYAIRPLTVDGVAPNPEKIALALANSDGLSTTDVKIPDANGGYPLSYVNKLIVRTDKMTIAKANAVASIIRYAVQDGQKFADKVAVPQLPASHVLKALKGANEIIKAVCPSADRIRSTGKVTVTGEEVSFDECGPKLAVVATTTTTTTIAATTTTTTTTTTIAATTSSSATTSTTQATAVLNNNTSRTQTPAAKTTTKAPTPTTTTLAPTTTTPVTTAATTSTTVKKKVTTATTEPEPTSSGVQPVTKPGRRRSAALPLLAGAGFFRFGGWIARRRAGDDSV
jgi:hypothetical protein